MLFRERHLLQVLDDAGVQGSKGAVGWDCTSCTSTETETLPGMRWRLSRCLVEVHLGFLVLVLCTSYNLNLLHRWR